MRRYEGERKPNLNDLYLLGFEDFNYRTIPSEFISPIESLKIPQYAHKDVGYSKTLAFYPVCWIGGKPDMTSVQLRIYDRNNKRWGDYLRSPRHLENWYIYQTGRRANYER